MAIMARWRIPPENWWGYSWARWAGLAMPTSPSRSTARFRAATRPTFSWTWMTSATWWPTLNTGLSDVSGSWKIIEISLPRMARSSFSPASSRSRPWNRMRPDSNRPGGTGTSPITARADTDLPDPDSPTMPSVSPRPDRPAHPVDRLHHPGVGVEVDPQVLDAEQRRLGVRPAAAPAPASTGGHRRRGSSASRRPSPTNTKPSTVNTTAMLGKNHRKSLYPKNFWPAEIMFPQSGDVGLAGRRRGSSATPRPRWRWPRSPWRRRAPAPCCWAGRGG